MAEIILEACANQITHNSQWSVELVNHVHKRTENFVYLDKVLGQSVPVAYIENEEIDSWRNLQVVDRSWSIPGNTPSRIGDRAPFDQVTAGSYTSAYRDLMVTDQTFVDEYGKTRPLFLRHSLDSTTVQVELRVLSGGERFDVDSGYVYDATRNVIYTNYENFYNPDTGAYRLYFVISTMSDGTQKHELLSPVPAAKEATWEDIDPSTGYLTTSYPVYSKESSGGTYTIYFNENKTWYIKPIDLSVVQPRLPIGREPEDPWYMRFTNGSITTSGHTYYIPEYEAQPFAPTRPFLFSVYERMMFVNSNNVSATRGNLAIDPDGYRHFTLYIYDSDDVLIRVLTTDTSLEGTRYQGTQVYYESDRIVAWDNRSGIISLGIKVHPSWTLHGQYYYEADDFEYTGVNLNPLQDTTKLERLYVFYLVPDMHSTDRAIHYLGVNGDGIIAECSQGDGFSYDNLQKTDSLGNYNPNTVIGTPYIAQSGTSFVTDYTINNGNSFGYAILAEVSVADNGWIEDQVVYDVRRDGMTLTEESFVAALKRNPRILQSDVVYGPDGQDVPRNAVMYIRAPITLLEEYGGRFNQAQAETFIRRHLNSATHPLIEWEYPQSELTGSSVTTAQVDLEATWEVPSADYKLYRRNNPTDAWSLLQTNSSPALGTISYTDTTVVSGEVYYYSVRITVDGVEMPFGNSLSVIAA